MDSQVTLREVVKHAKKSCRTCAGSGYFHATHAKGSRVYESAGECVGRRPEEIRELKVCPCAARRFMKQRKPALPQG